MQNNRLIFLLIGMISLYSSAQEYIWDVYANQPYALQTRAEKPKTDWAILSDDFYFQTYLFADEQTDWAKLNALVWAEGHRLLNTPEGQLFLTQKWEHRKKHAVNYLRTTRNENTDANLKLALTSLEAHLVSVIGHRAIVAFELSGELQTNSYGSDLRCAVTLYYHLDRHTQKLQRLENRFNPEQLNRLSEKWASYLPTEWNRWHAEFVSNQSGTDEVITKKPLIDWNEVAFYPDFGGLLFRIPAFTSASASFNYAEYIGYIPAEKTIELLDAFPQFHFLKQLPVLQAKRNYATQTKLEAISRLHSEPTESFWISSLATKKKKQLTLRRYQLHSDHSSTELSQEEWIFNAKNRLAERRIYQQGALLENTQYFYDEQGLLQVEWLLDRQAKKKAETRYQYDPLGNPTKLNKYTNSDATTTYWLYNGDFVYQLQISEEVNSHRLPHYRSSYRSVYQFNPTSWKIGNTTYHLDEKGQIESLSSPLKANGHPQFFRSTNLGSIQWEYHQDNDREMVLQTFNSNNVPVELTAFDGYNLRKNWKVVLDESGFIPLEWETETWHYGQSTRLKTTLEWQFEP